MKEYKCPCCKSTDIKDVSQTKSNGVIGSGFSSWVVFECWMCNSCGVLFRKIKK